MGWGICVNALEDKACVPGKRPREEDVVFGRGEKENGCRECV